MPDDTRLLFQLVGLAHKICFIEFDWLESMSSKLGEFDLAR